MLKDNDFQVLEWLIQHQSSASDEDTVERVGEQELDIMVRTVDHLLVLFHDGRGRDAKRALEALENVDDECDVLGVSFVEISDAEAAAEHGVASLNTPTLVYFEEEVPTVYGGRLQDHAAVLQWLTALVEGADIEEVTKAMLEKMVVREEKVAFPS